MVVVVVVVDVYKNIKTVERWGGGGTLDLLQFLLLSGEVVV